LVESTCGECYGIISGSLHFLLLGAEIHLTKERIVVNCSKPSRSSLIGRIKGLENKCFTGKTQGTLIYRFRWI